jgi:acyl-coenzyme A thioesterase PaaI-like protein
MMEAMREDIAVQDIYPDDFSHCFGCGRLNAAGHQIKTFARDGETVTDFRPEPTHIATNDFTYGGIIASVIDCHSTGSAAIFWMYGNGLELGSSTAPRFVTARLEIDFIAPTALEAFTLIGTADEIAARKVVVSTLLQSREATTVRGRAVLVKVADPETSGGPPPG